jgi:hypothetical protein
LGIASAIVAYTSYDKLDLKLTVHILYIAAISLIDLYSMFRNKQVINMLGLIFSMPIFLFGLLMEFASFVELIYGQTDWMALALIIVFMVLTIM